MVERARLESECTRKGTEGSNPSLSAGFLLTSQNYRPTRLVASMVEHLYIPGAVAKIDFLDFCLKPQESHTEVSPGKISLA